MASRNRSEAERLPPEAHRPATVERRGELHAALVAAAERIIEADGVEAVRARTLAVAAGCSVGAIYNVTADLDSLILDANARTLDAIDAALRAAVSSAATDAAPGLLLDRLAVAYHGSAAAHTRRWSALFTHRMTAGAPVPEWYRARQAAMFTHVEAPLAALRPDLQPGPLALLARSLFSAVHGIVLLGLSGTLLALPLDAQREQLRMLVAAMARGLEPP